MKQPINMNFMKFFFKFLLVFFSLSNLFGQTNISKAYKNIYAAEVLLKEKKYKESLKRFEKSFKLKYTENPDYLIDAAYVAFKLKKFRKGYSFLEKAIVFYRVPLNHIERNDRLVEYSNRILKIKKNYSSLYAKSFSYMNNIQAYYEVDKLKQLDQYVRNFDAYYSGYMVEDFDNIPESGKPKYLNNNSYIDFKNQVFKKTDSLNALKLIEITKKFGYQKNSWLILWHHRTTFDTNNYFWSFFKPKISSEIKLGEIEASYFAPFEDTINILKFQKQKYGTQSYYPIEDLDNVDKLRAEVNLPPLYYEHYIYNTPLPKGYTLNYTDFIRIIFKNID